MNLRSRGHRMFRTFRRFVSVRFALLLRLSFPLLTVSKLRHYESLRLVTPHRTPSNQRLFSTLMLSAFVLRLAGAERSFSPSLRLVSCFVSSIVASRRMRCVRGACALFRMTKFAARGRALA